MAIDPNWLGEHPMYPSVSYFIITIVEEIQDASQVPGVTFDQIYQVVEEYNMGPSGDINGDDYDRFTSDGVRIENPSREDIRDILDKASKEDELVYVKSEDKYYHLHSEY